MAEDSRKKSEVYTIKYGFHLKPNISAMIDSHLELAGTSTRSKFIEAAVKHYCGFIDAESNGNIIGEEVKSIIKSSVKDSDNRQAKLHFKIAGEMALMNNLLAKIGISLSDEEIRELRNLSYNMVRNRHGFIHIEDCLVSEYTEN